MSRFEDSYGVACCLDWSNEKKECAQTNIKCDRRKQLLKSCYKLDYCKDDTERLKRELERRYEKSRKQDEKNINSSITHQSPNMNCFKSPKCHRECKIEILQCDHHKPCLMKSNSCDQIKTKIIEECRKINDNINQKPDKDYRKKRLNETFITVKNDRFDRSPVSTKKNKIKSSAKAHSKSLNRTHSINEKLNEKEVKFMINQPCSISPRPSYTVQEKMIKCEATQTSPQNSYSELIKPVKRVQNEKKAKELREPITSGPLSNSTLIEELKKLSKYFNLKRKPKTQVFNDDTESDFSEFKSVSSSILSLLYSDNYDDGEEKKSKITISKKQSKNHDYDYENYKQNGDDDSEYSFKITMANDKIRKKKSKNQRHKIYHKNSDEFCHYIPIKCHDKVKTRTRSKSYQRRYDENSFDDLYELCKKCKRIKL